jgi:hypothetical protein
MLFLLLTVHCRTVFPCPACSAQLLALRRVATPCGSNPSRLNSGGQFATTSAAFRARQAAHALLTTAQHLCLGSRQAETVRATWDHSSVPGLSAESPVWLLGLSGLLVQFQDILGTGFRAVYYHCKGYMDFGMPEYLDILLYGGPSTLPTFTKLLRPWSTLLLQAPSFWATVLTSLGESC